MPEEVIVALGSNEGDRYQNLVNARKFLSGLSRSSLQASSIYDTEPVGPSEKRYYNAVIFIETDLPPQALLKKFKEYEKKRGRDLQAPRWSDRVIDLDIIAYGTKKISDPELIIPHSQYSQRLFVLLPMNEVKPEWIDPVSGKKLKEMITDAPALDVKKLDLDW